MLSVVALSACSYTFIPLTPRPLELPPAILINAGSTLTRSQDRIVLRARHFGGLPELAMSSDLLSIVPAMYANNLRQRYDFRVWGIPDAPTYEVRMVWHSSTDNDSAHQWMRSLVQRLFQRSGL